MNFIGLGKVGCNIADVLGSFDDANPVFKINSGLLGIKPGQTPEQYEQDFPGDQIKKLFKEIDEKQSTVFVVCGANLVSAMALRALELLPKENLTLLYVIPQKSQLTIPQRTNDKIVFNVLQQYARSGHFKEMVIIQNDLTEKYIGQMPIKGYWEKLNDTIARTFFIVASLVESGPVLGVNPTPAPINRLATLGVVSKDNQIMLFHDLPEVRQLHYVFGFNERRLTEESTLLRDIKAQVAQNKLPTTYGIYETPYENDYTYAIAYTNSVREVK